MVKLDVADNRIWLTDHENGINLELFDCQDLYQNTTNLPFAYTADNRMTIMGWFIQLSREVFGIATEIPDGKIGFLICLSRLFQACMGRNQEIWVLMDGVEELRGVCGKTIHFFNEQNHLSLLQSEMLPLYEKEKFSIAIVDGRNFSEGNKSRFAAIVRLVRREGVLIVVAPDGKLDSAVRQQLGESGYEKFGVFETWMVKVTDSLVRWAMEQDKTAETEDKIEMLLGLWEQIQCPLSEVSESPLTDINACEWQNELLNSIAILHAMEDLIIELYGQLNHLDLKILINWTKMAAMDLYLEMCANRTETIYFQKKLKEAFSEFMEAMEGEFG